MKIFLTNLVNVVSNTPFFFVKANDIKLKTTFLSRLSFQSRLAGTGRILRVCVCGSRSRSQGNSVKGN